MSKRRTTYQFSHREQLELFLARSTELYEARILRSGYHPSFSFGWNHIEGMKIGCTEPNEDDLRSFLTIYRKFISQDSPVFINKVFNICQRFLSSEQIKEELIEVREKWSNELRYGFMGLNIDNVDLNPEKLCDLWLNAAYFHDDADKIRELESLMPNIMSYVLVRQNFLNHLWQTTKYILYIAYLVRVSFKENLFGSSI